MPSDEFQKTTMLFFLKRHGKEIGPLQFLEISNDQWKKNP
jgi:hypothetical protein